MINIFASNVIIFYGFVSPRIVVGDTPDGGGHEDKTGPVRDVLLSKSFNILKTFSNSNESSYLMSNFK